MFLRTLTGTGRRHFGGFVIRPISLAIDWPDIGQPNRP